MGIKDRFKAIKETDDKPNKDKKGKSKPAAAPKRKQKRSLFSKIGVEKVGQKSLDDLATEKRHRIMEQTWDYLRKHIDGGVTAYLESGDGAMLSRLMSEDLYRKLATELDQMKNEGISWRYAQRKAKSGTNVEVLDERLNIQTGKPEEFTILEGFNDYSQVTASGGNTVVAEGEFRKIKATIELRDVNEAKVPVVVRLVQD